MIVALSFASGGIAGIVVTLDEESVLAFIAATVMSFVDKGQISFVLSLIGRRAWTPVLSLDECSLVTRFLWILLLMFRSKVSTSWNGQTNFGGNWGSSGPNNHKMDKMLKYNQGMNKYSDISECPSRVKKETDQSILLDQPSFPPMRNLNFSGSSCLTFKKCPRWTNWLFSQENAHQWHWWFPSSDHQPSWGARKYNSP